MTTPSERARVAKALDDAEEKWNVESGQDANECNLPAGLAQVILDCVLTLVADAVREEREACAVVVEADPPDKNAMTPGDLAVYRVHAKNIARRIRARTPASGEEKG